jgi:GT2 family glycosyltransferase
MFGQTYNWLPLAELEELERTLVVIPTFKNNTLTWDVVNDCLREPVRIVVVDNSNDYQAIAGEIVIRPGRNLGWLRSNNLAIKNALQEDSWNRIVFLNNDVRLSASFFAGIIWAERHSAASIVAASYDDLRSVQRPEQLAAGQTLDAHQYNPEPRNIPTGACDGTAVSIRRDALESIGLFDEERFGKYGWGGTEDLCFRARAASLSIVVTRAAYVHHIGGGHQTAKQTIGQPYVKLADDEGNSGMSEKWGPHWRWLTIIPTQAEVNDILGSGNCKEDKL